VANDTMAGAVVNDLKRQSLNGKVAVSGQDATAEGLQHILDGDQCFSIYKASKDEAAPAIKSIAQLVNGKVPDTKGVTITDPQTKKPVPAILATPVPVTIDNVADPINDKYTPKNTVCTGAYAAKCAKAGVK
jgi:D-xylose transport system substrate-binding protein